MLCATMNSLKTLGKPHRMETRGSKRLCITYAAVGHAVMHILTALYLTLVVGLERIWNMPYEELLALWTVGALLIGLGAPLAGYLADKWDEAKMMVAFYIITGFGCILAGASSDTSALWKGLIVLGVGASIYHPVGLSWIVRVADNPGQAIGITGLLGTVGIALASALAGLMLVNFGWRSAFIVPGTISILIGFALATEILTHRIGGEEGRIGAPKPAGRGETIRAFVFLTLTMAAGALVFNVQFNGMPKWFEQRTLGLGGGDTLGLDRIGLLVTIVYSAAAGSQFLGGMLVDRFPAKVIYVLGFMIQAPLIILSGLLFDLPMVLIAALTVLVQGATLPAENILLARYTPAGRRGLAFGVKFVLAFGITPVALYLVGNAADAAGGIAELIVAMGILIGFATFAAMAIPSGNRHPVPTPSTSPVPAE